MRFLRNFVMALFGAKKFRQVSRRNQDEPLEPIITPQLFHGFTYSKRSHFQSLRRHADHIGESLEKCDLKVYQDMLTYNFILQNLPRGAKLLEIGGGDSRVIRWLKDRYEFWNLDRLEGIGNGRTSLPAISGFHLVRDYIGAFSKEIPDRYFDGVFSISVLEHVPRDTISMEAIRKDMQRLLKPGGFSLHCIDIVIKKEEIQMHPLVDFLYSRENVINQRLSADIIRNDPDLWGMTEVAYNKNWISACRNLPFENFGIPISYNLLWRKAE